MVVVVVGVDFFISDESCPAVVSVSAFASEENANNRTPTNAAHVKIALKCVMYILLF